jgi:hypothetical protein
VKIVKNERDPPLFTGKLVIKFQNILRNTTQVIIRHRVKILFSIISSPITLERQKWKSSPLFTSKQLIKFWKILRNTTQTIVQHRICLQTDVWTDMVKPEYPPCNFVAGGITITSPDKDWSMLSPKYLTLFREEIIWLLQETWKLLNYVLNQKGYMYIQFYPNVDNLLSTNYITSYCMTLILCQVSLK